LQHESFPLSPGRQQQPLALAFSSIFLSNFSNILAKKRFFLGSFLFSAFWGMVISPFLSVLPFYLATAALDPDGLDMDQAVRDLFLGGGQNPGKCRAGNFHQLCGIRLF
jgi:hypothetical protein